MLMKRFLFGLPVLLLLVSSAIHAQRPPAIITGRVMILDSMRPAAGAFVRIQSHNVAAVADSAGRYRLVVPDGRIGDGDVVEVTASRVGLNAERRQIPLAAGSEVVVDFGVKTSMFRDQDPCYGLIPRGGPPREPVVDEKLCRMTTLYGARRPGDRHPQP
jgi:hypothetical protein